MNTITVNDYHQRIEDRVDESYVLSPPKKKPASSGKSRGIRWGKQAEEALIEFLREHPFVEEVMTQVRFRPVGGLSCIDVVLKMKNGETVYIPVVKDSWTGTAQVDRLETLYAKFKGGLISRYNVCWFIAKDYKIRLQQTFTDVAIKEVLINEIITEMAEAGLIYNIETLWEFLNTFDVSERQRKWRLFTHRASGWFNGLLA